MRVKADIGGSDDSERQWDDVSGPLRAVRSARYPTFEE